MKYRSWFSLIQPDPPIISVLVSVLLFHHLLLLILLHPLPVLSAAASSTGVMMSGRSGLEQTTGNFDNNHNNAEAEDRHEAEDSLHPTGPDSAEDGQYYDDDPGVTFITEDDIYDDFAPGGDSHPTTIARFYSNEGSLTTRKLVDHERCPPVPQEPADVKLCQQTKCTSDSQCSQDGSVICCYNGCVHSCQHKVDPPRVFDWLEETQLKEVENLSRLPPPPSGGSLSTRQLMNADNTKETIAIPGGCFLTSQQYDHLRLFRQLQHVDSCTCLQGDVVCHVNTTRY